MSLHLESFQPFKSLPKTDKTSINNRLTKLRDYLLHYFKYVETEDIKHIYLMNFNIALNSKDEYKVEVAIVFNNKQTPIKCADKTLRAVKYFFKDNIDSNISQNTNSILFDIDNLHLSLTCI